MGGLGGAFCYQFMPVQASFTGFSLFAKPVRDMAAVLLYLLAY